MKMPITIYRTRKQPIPAQAWKRLAIGLIAFGAAAAAISALIS
jgi:hypothetical protein